MISLMDFLQSIFHQFIKIHWNKKSPLLLGFSGGPDSTALFHLLLKAQVPFSAAHINHRWRQESDQEALELRKLSEKNGVPFFEKVLEAPRSQKNLEDQGRDFRLKFFKELMEIHHFQALLLAHQAEDVAETVIKRLFEGASLHHISGPRPVSQIDGMTIWRPLLEVTKDDLLKWLKMHEVNYFIDHTNLDSRFLRGRMRTTLMPLLSEIFGKNVTSSLARIGNASKELAEFLEKVSPFKARECVIDGCRSLDLSDASQHTPFEMKFVIRWFFEKHKLVLSIKNIDAIYLHLKRKSVHKELIVGRQKVRLHKGILQLGACVEKRPIFSEAN